MCPLTIRRTFSPDPRLRYKTDRAAALPQLHNDWLASSKDSTSGHQSTECFVQSVQAAMKKGKRERRNWRQL